MRKYAILQNLDKGINFGVVVRSEGTQKFYGWSEKGIEWSQWANANKASLSDLPFGISVSEFRGMSDEMMKSIILNSEDAQAFNEGGITSKTLLFASGSEQFANTSRYPTVTNTCVPAESTAKKIAVSFKVKSFKNSVAQSELTFGIRMNELAFDINTKKFNSKPSRRNRFAARNNIREKMSRGSERKFGQRIVDSVNAKIYKDSGVDFYSRQNIGQNTKDILDVFAKSRLGYAIGRGIGAAGRALTPNRGTRGRMRGMASRFISGELDPRRRRDVDNDGMIFDGTWREMPDPSRFVEAARSSSDILSGLNTPDRNRRNRPGAPQGGAGSNRRFSVSQTPRTAAEMAPPSRPPRTKRLQLVDTRNSRLANRITYDADNGDTTVYYRSGRIEKFESVPYETVRKASVDGTADAMIRNLEKQNGREQSIDPRDMGLMENRYPKRRPGFSDIVDELQRSLDNNANFPYQAALNKVKRGEALSEEEKKNVISNLQQELKKPIYKDDSRVIDLLKFLKNKDSDSDGARSRSGGGDGSTGRTWNLQERVRKSPVGKRREEGKIRKPKGTRGEERSRIRKDPDSKPARSASNDGGARSMNTTYGTVWRGGSNFAVREILDSFARNNQGGDDFDRAMMLAQILDDGRTPNDSVYASPNINRLTEVGDVIVGAMHGFARMPRNLPVPDQQKYIREVIADTIERMNLRIPINQTKPLENYLLAVSSGFDADATDVIRKLEGIEDGIYTGKTVAARAIALEMYAKRAIGAVDPDYSGSEKAVIKNRGFRETFGPILDYVINQAFNRAGDSVPGMDWSDRRREAEKLDSAKRMLMSGGTGAVGDGLDETNGGPELINAIGEALKLHGDDDMAKDLRNLLKIVNDAFGKGNRNLKRRTAPGRRDDEQIEPFPRPDGGARSSSQQTISRARRAIRDGGARSSSDGPDLGDDIKDAESILAKVANNQKITREERDLAVLRLTLASRNPDVEESDREALLDAIKIVNRAYDANQDGGARSRSSRQRTLEDAFNMPDQTPTDGRIGYNPLIDNQRKERDEEVRRIFGRMTEEFGKLAREEGIIIGGLAPINDPGARRLPMGRTRGKERDIPLGARSSSGARSDSDDRGNNDVWVMAEATMRKLAEGNEKPSLKEIDNLLGALRELRKGDLAESSRVTFMDLENDLKNMRKALYPDALDDVDGGARSRSGGGARSRSSRQRTLEDALNMPDQTPTDGRIGYNPLIDNQRKERDEEIRRIFGRMTEDFGKLAREQNGGARSRSGARSDSNDRDNNDVWVMAENAMRKRADNQKLTREERDNLLEAIAELRKGDLNESSRAVLIDLEKELLRERELQNVADSQEEDYIRDLRPGPDDIDGGARSRSNNGKRAQRSKVTARRPGVRPLGSNDTRSNSELLDIFWSSIREWNDSTRMDEATLSYVRNLLNNIVENRGNNSVLRRLARLALNDLDRQGTLGRDDEPFEMDVDSTGAGSALRRGRTRSRFDKEPPRRAMRDGGGRSSSGGARSESEFSRKIPKEEIDEAFQKLADRLDPEVFPPENEPGDDDVAPIGSLTEVNASAPMYRVVNFMIEFDRMNPTNSPLTDANRMQLRQIRERLRDGELIRRRDVALVVPFVTALIEADIQFRRDAIEQSGDDPGPDRDILRMAKALSDYAEFLERQKRNMKRRRPNDGDDLNRGMRSSSGVGGGDEPDLGDDITDVLAILKRVNDGELLTDEEIELARTRLMLLARNPKYDEDERIGVLDTIGKIEKMRRQSSGARSSSDPGLGDDITDVLATMEKVADNQSITREERDLAALRLGILARNPKLSEEERIGILDTIKSINRAFDRNQNGGPAARSSSGVSTRRPVDQSLTSRMARANVERSSQSRGARSSSSATPVTPDNVGERLSFTQMERTFGRQMGEGDGAYWASLSDEEKEKVKAQIAKLREKIEAELKQVFGKYWRSQTYGAGKQSLRAVRQRAKGKGGRYERRPEDDRLTPVDIEEMSRRLVQFVMSGALQKFEMDKDGNLKLDADGNAVLSKPYLRAQKSLDNMLAILAMEETGDFSPLEHLHSSIKTSIAKATGKRGKNFGGKPSSVAMDAGGESSKKLPSQITPEELGKGKKKLPLSMRILRVDPKREARARQRALRRGTVVSGRILDPKQEIEQRTLRARAFKRQMLSRFRRTRNPEQLSAALIERKSELTPIKVDDKGNVTIDRQYVRVLSVLDGKLGKKDTADGPKRQVYDQLLADLWANFNYSNVPVLVRRDEIVDLVKAGWQPIIRGTGSETVSSETYVEQFLRNPDRFIPGQGQRMYGVGEYFAFPNSAQWLSFRGKDTDRHTIIALLPPSADIVTVDELSRELNKMRYLSTNILDTLKSLGGESAVDAMAPGEIVAAIRRNLPDLDKETSRSGQIVNQLVDRLQEMDGLPPSPALNQEKKQIIDALDYLARFTKQGINNDKDVGYFAPIVGVDAIDANSTADNRNPILLHNRSMIVAFEVPTTSKEAESMATDESGNPVKNIWRNWANRPERGREGDARRSGVITRVMRGGRRRRGGGDSGDETPTPTTSAPQVSKSAINVDAWDSSRPQKTGSNPAVILTDPQGTKYYAKTPRSGESLAIAQERMETEVLAGKLYELAGIPVVDLQMGSRQGQPVSMSRMIGTSSNIDNNAALDGFVVDAWLANWDVTENDNLQMDLNGRPIRMDVGGSLDFRAQGSRKGTDGTKPFGPKVDEMASMKKRGGNVDFSNIDRNRIKAQVQKLGTITEDDIRNTVNAIVTDPARAKVLADTLIARRNDIISRFG